MKILAIETSCDETAIAMIEALESKSGADFSILSNQISSQVNIHRPFGGVVPNLAKREHIKNLPVLLKKVLENLTPTPLLRKERGKKITNPLSPYEGGRAGVRGLDFIAVTSGPGLEPALWTGINFAQELVKKYKLPLIPVNHLEGHIYSSMMRNPKFKILNPKQIFPLLTLIVSGGHTELVLTKKHLEHKILGETLDDAAGEAFDKVARMLELPYPGGPEISKLAKSGNPKAVNFPRPMINSKDLNFSFSGLKTSVLYYLRDLQEGGPRAQVLKDLAQPDGASRAIREPANMRVLSKLGAKAAADIAASFEQAVVDVLVSKTLKAVEKYKPKTVALGGGVAANDKLREELSRKLGAIGHTLLLPEKQFTGDNAAMIAVAAYFKTFGKKFPKPETIKAEGNLRLTK
ncbi:MAG: tRNA (adenosine(37)-N6)-threonylcarbamoyltransferase complex transferase subunit TsaD [bacterium]|nr:tRNA (adenosine(37)-N6)-threonylcarbamoyltransferase complex transferase subunit TsaD [bacterium]